MPKGRVVYGPTPMQKRGVDNILSGKYNAAAPALRDAGYKPKTVINPQENFFKAQGVGLYLKTLSKVAKKRWNVSLPDKVALTYLDGLEATKLYGKNAIEAPDYMARKVYADRFAEFFGWTHGDLAPGAKLQQFNFFSVDEKTRNDFNSHFREFLKQL
ncbi:MAG: hypothetical protein UV58_C0013G0008 [Candidatus Wolfebacteria bacterium GW2011_GWC1_43_10]|uniref:Uncharacterized protein n=1 Tax=Candidatus Wolfebacteria bacterium GW2011_GWC1_43_10 TaxID=1619011 RepID=A0A0G1C8S9_9BACT|nr:MAG: hypothetical protein UV58_C0013G0008 [Candidatus Wolfebacteria bacterium GW2011_GWC1_43_10]HZX13020.1 hypothetical protein [Thermodesulfobacteriota bacterium]